MFQWIITLVVIGVIYYFYRRLRRRNADWKYDRQRARITEDKVQDQWSALIEKANGRGDELIENVAKVVRDAQIPYVSVAKRMISIDRAAQHPFLVVSNEKFKGYELLVGAYDYGPRLNVLWYFIFDSPVMIETRRAERIGGQVHRQNMAPLKRKAREEGYFVPEDLTMLDKQELSNYTSIVHQALKDEVKLMMDGLKLEYSKVDFHTRGFLNLS